MTRLDSIGAPGPSRMAVSQGFHTVRAWLEARFARSDEDDPR